MNLRSMGALAVALPLFMGCEPPGISGSSKQPVTMLATVAAEGSMAPNIASGHDGSVVLSWIEPDDEGHALRHASLREGAWSDPRTVVRGDNWFVNWADFPSVVPVSDTLWAAHWLVSQEAGGYAYNVHTAVSADKGDTWSDAVIPHSDGTETEHGFVTLFPESGGIGMVWLDGRKMVNDYDENDKLASSMTLRSATIDQDLLPFKEAQVDDMVCDCCQTDVALTDDGPIAIYRNRTAKEIRDIYVSRREFGEWQPGHAVSDDNWEIAACPVNGPVVQADGSSVAVAWFTAPDEKARVKVAWSDDSGRTFTAPVVVSDDHPLGRVGAALLADGDIVVSWLRSSGGGSAELLISKVSREGARADPYVLAEAADVFAFSVPQLVQQGTDLVVAWTVENDRTYGVRSAIVPLSQLD